MSELKNRRIVLAARPNGHPRADDFDIVEQPIPPLGDGEVLFRNLFISLDPYHRNLMGNAASTMPPIEIGQSLSGATVAVVEDSRNPAFAAGDHVVTMAGWQEYGTSDGMDLRTIDPAAAPLTAALGVLGHTGLTAWVGLTKILDAKPGGTLVVTAAAGAVGSVAAQIAKLRGHRVVGVAGGVEKLRYLTDTLGLDAAVDYKADDFAEQLARALPQGIDALFDNVGGAVFEALMPHFSENARIVVCGIMSQMTQTGDHPGPDRIPDLLQAFLYKFIIIRGFSVMNHFDSYPEFIAEVGPWLGDGSLRYDEDVIEGLENIPAGFTRLFEGRTLGKLIARV